MSIETCLILIFISGCNLEIAVNDGSGGRSNQGAGSIAPGNFPVVDTNTTPAPSDSADWGSDAGSAGLSAMSNGIVFLEFIGNLTDSLGLNSFEGSSDNLQYLPNSRGDSTSIYLNGTSDYVFYDINRGNAFNMNNRMFSIAFWFSTTATGTQYFIAQHYKHAHPDNRIMDFLNMKLVAGQVEATFNTDWGGSNQVTLNSTTTDLNDGNWHHVAFVRTGARMADLYINGILEASDTNNSGNASGINPINSNLYIGRDVQGDSYFKGYLDDFYWVDGVTLTSGEVSNLFNR